MKDIKKFYVGLLVASDWDSNGKVIATKLALRGEKNISIKLNGSSNELLGLIGSTVKVWGNLDESKEILELKLLKYEIIDE